MLEEAKYKLYTTEQTYGIVRETLDTKGFMGWQQCFFLVSVAREIDEKRNYDFLIDLLRVRRVIGSSTRTIQCAVH